MSAKEQKGGKPKEKKLIAMKCYFEGKNLDKKDWFGKSDPYLIINRICDNGSLQLIHKTPCIKKTLNPIWEPFVITVESAGRREVQFKIFCYDWDKNKEDDLIGEFYTTLSDMMKAASDTVCWDIINPKKFQHKRNYKNSGHIYLTDIELMDAPPGAP